MTHKSIVKTGYLVLVLVFVAALMRSTTLVAGAQAGCPYYSNEEQYKYEHCLGLVSRLLRAMG